MRMRLFSCASVLGTPLDELLGEGECLFGLSDIGFDVILNLVRRLDIHQESYERGRIDLKTKRTFDVLAIYSLLSRITRAASVGGIQLTCESMVDSVPAHHAVNSSLGLSAWLNIFWRFSSSFLRALVFFVCAAAAAAVGLGDTEAGEERPPTLLVGVLALTP